jgi:ABC-type Fe3+-hydroxamate transport system substrate-binding protein
MLPVLAGPPRRAVSLVPSVTGSLFDLGLGHCLAGVSDYCVVPGGPAAADNLPRVGGTKNPDCRKIIGLGPDLVIANQEENRPEDVALLRSAGLAVWVTFPCTVRQALDLLWDTIRIFGAPHLSQVLTVLEKSVEWASQAADNRPPVRAFCPIWRDQAVGAPEWWMTFNRNTYMHDVLRVCGAHNVFCDRDRRYPLAADLDPGHAPDPANGRDVRYPRVSVLEVEASAPDVILLPSEPYPFGQQDLGAFDGYSNMPAVTNGRIHLVDGSLLTWPGTRLAQALAELPALLLV